MSNKSPQRWSFAGWRFTPDRGDLSAPDGRAVDLSRQEARLLAVLLEAGGRTLTRDYLLEAIGEPERPVFDRAIDKLVNRLRQKLGDDGRQPHFIRTQRGFGYSFAEVVESLIDVAIGPNLGAPSVDRPTIAIWPFQNLSGEAQFDHLAAGLTDEVIVALARSANFIVAGRSAAYAYGVGKATDLDRVRRELVTHYVVEGSLRKRGDDMRVSVHLAERETGRRLWGEKFDRPLQRLLAVPEEVTDSIIAIVKPRLYRAGAARVQGIAPEHVDAWSLLARGMIAFFSMSPSGLREAIDLAHEAISRTPGYASAHALLSVASRTLVANGGDGDPAEMNAQSLAAARRAVELDPDNGVTFGALGTALAFTGQARDAIPALERALEIDPSDGPIAAALALARVYLGQVDEAMAAAERAVKLSRNDPISGYFTWFALASVETLRGHFDAAEEAVRRAVATNATYAWSWVLLANILGMQGNVPEAKTVLAHVARAFGGMEKLARIYRTLHLTRFERGVDVANMVKGLKAAGFES
ncbi:MAG TPA: winged helix-turn-helix domain-containing protein [Reyranella sp.]